jgi:transcriptional regulator with XRE-family HTH domain
MSSNIFDASGMATIGDSGSPQSFARAFTDALKNFLDENHLGQSEAARKLGIETVEEGKRKGGARISSYCCGRAKPDAEILYLLCAKLGFNFEYNGFRITAETMNGKRPKPSGEPSKQLTFEFERQFNLTRKQGIVTVKVRRRTGRIDVSLSLDGKTA